MTESKVMKELREVRDKISEEIKDMTAEQMKDYFHKDSENVLKEIEKIRASKSRAV